MEHTGGRRDSSGAPGIPIYQTIKNRLRARMDSGELPEGARVPSEERLATELGISRGQARQALRDLEMEGYLLRHPGRGSFVAPSGHRRGRRARPDLRTVLLAYPGLARHNGSYHVRKMVEGFVALTHERGYHSTFYYVDYDLEAELRFLSRLDEYGVAGLALWPQFRTSEECALVERLSHSQLPCVLIDRYLPGVEADFVGTANRLAVEQLTSTLIARGRRKLAYVTRDFADSVMEDRVAGFRHALHKAGIEARDEWVAERSLDRPTMFRYFQGLQERKAFPTAVVCSDNWSAANVVAAVERCGRTVPGDVEVAAMDDSVELESPVPLRWFAAVQDGCEIGRQAADLLLSRIAAPAKSLEQRFVRPHFLPPTGGGHTATTPE